MFYVRSRVHTPPVLLPETSELEDRERFGGVKSLTEDLRDLLGN
jgi:hypothetical protein